LRRDVGFRGGKDVTEELRTPAASEMDRDRQSKKSAKGKSGSSSGEGIDAGRTVEAARILFP